MILERSVSDNVNSKCKGPGARLNETCDIERPAFLEQSEGERVEDRGDGEAGRGPIMTSLLWNLGKDLERLSQIEGNHYRAFSRRVNLIQVTLKEDPCLFPSIREENLVMTWIGFVAKR